MNSSERRMKLILMLQQTTNRLHVKDIAEKFGISERTVYRDFNALSEMNVPVIWDKYSGYGVVDNYKIAPLMFTSKELATIMMGLNFVKSQVDKKLIRDAEGVELKIKEVLPDDLLDFMDSLEKRTIVDPYLNYGAEKIEGGDWYIISNAISNNQSIEFNYRAKTDESISSRKVNPYILVFYRDHWNLIGHSKKRDAVRNFVLDRMSDIAILPQNFTPYGKINPESLIFRSEDTSHKIVLDVYRKALDRFKANLPAKILNIEEHKPNLLRVSFSFDNLGFINEWLLQFPKDITIIEPKQLIEKRNDLLREMINDKQATS